MMHVFQISVMFFSLTWTQFLLPLNAADIMIGDDKRETSSDLGTVSDWRTKP